MLHNLKYLPRDTSIEAARVMYSVLRGLPSERNSELRAELNERLRASQRCGIRNRHPEYSEEQVEMALRRLRLGKDLFEKVYPFIKINP